MSAIEEYWMALGRLEAGKPIRIPKGSKITKDNVSLEAGRSKGSIKKSRPMFAELIAAIELASSKEAERQNTDKIRLVKAKSSMATLREQLDSALARELSLINQVFELKRQIAQLTGSNVFPLVKDNAR